jgi:hypothetical protein
MQPQNRLMLVGALVLGATGCNFLKGGELTTNPNVASASSPATLFAGIQPALWATLGSDMSRIAMLLTQQIAGANQQYTAIADYNNDPSTVTNGFHQALYLGGGLVDIRNTEHAAAAAGDTVFLGIAQVFEAWTMGQGADLFGDLVYSAALGENNPPLDKQTVVYAHVQALLDTAIQNLAHTGPKDAGPGAVDLVYGGDPALWTALAHTLKARFYMHTIKGAAAGVDTTAALTATLTEAAAGISSPAGDYAAQFAGTTGQQNLWFQFNGPAGRAGYYTGLSALWDTLSARTGDPRLADYFNADGSNLSDARLAPTAPQVFASYEETQLLLAEANARLGNTATAQGLLAAHYTRVGWTGHPNAATLTGRALLNAILVEKWISDFELGTESYTDYRRTCTPNLQPTVPGGHVPGRFFYDVAEQQTNTSIPEPGNGSNGFFNEVTPALAISDGTGTACLAYAP